MNIPKSTEKRKKAGEKKRKREKEKRKGRRKEEEKEKKREEEKAERERDKRERKGKEKRERVLIRKGEKGEIIHLVRVSVRMAPNGQTKNRQDRNKKGNMKVPFLQSFSSLCGLLDSSCIADASKISLWFAGLELYCRCIKNITPIFFGIKK